MLSGLVHITSKRLHSSYLENYLNCNKNNIIAILVYTQVLMAYYECYASEHILYMLTV